MRVIHGNSVESGGNASRFSNGSEGFSKNNPPLIGLPASFKLLPRSGDSDGSAWLIRSCRGVGLEWMAIGLSWPSFSTTYSVAFWIWILRDCPLETDHFTMANTSSGLTT